MIRFLIFIGCSKKSVRKGMMGQKNDLHLQCVYQLPPPVGGRGGGEGCSAGVGDVSDSQGCSEEGGEEEISFDLDLNQMYVVRVYDSNLNFLKQFELEKNNAPLEKAYDLYHEEEDNFESSISKQLKKVKNKKKT